MSAYRLKNTGRSSAQFGPCEVCRAHMAEAWIQSERRPYTRRDGAQGARHVDTLIGHRDCLVAMRA